MQLLSTIIKQDTFLSNKNAKCFSLIFYPTQISSKNFQCYIADEILNQFHHLVNGGIYIYILYFHFSMHEAIFKDSERNASATSLL